MTGGENLAYLLALNEFPKFGPRRLRRLFKALGSAKSIFEASASHICSAGIPETIAKEFVQTRSCINPNELIDLVASNSLHVLSMFDPTYPSLLKEIYDPPTILYIKGNVPNFNDQIFLAIVGARKPSDYGVQVAKQLTSEIAQSGIVTVSGLAYGIDQIVHESTIASHGQTIAVLGFGILHTATRRERRVQRAILDHGGCIMSEFPLLMPGHKQNFPVRNRIISGLSHGTLVIEAAEKSGSLITARSAMDQNREVFAVPGPINSPVSKGTNELIKNGAHVVTGINDILEPLAIQRVPIVDPETRSTRTGDTPEETTILTILSHQPTHIDELTRQSALPAHIIASTLSLLELKGFVQNIGGERYYLS